MMLPTLLALLLCARQAASAGFAIDGLSSDPGESIGIIFGIVAGFIVVCLLVMWKCGLFDSCCRCNGGYAEPQAAARNSAV